ncbi:ATP-binding protein [Roseomonas sp. CAU 1739]|uniref:ATP-binding protein n=1 Tax=Roseomonas sp. CAU 1739 TaxID=3140364 RepID=UPI0038D1B29A
MIARERLGAFPARFASRPDQGSGLGLSIVRMIAEQLGGELVIRSPASGREDRFEAILRFSQGFVADRAATAGC